MIRRGLRQPVPLLGGCAGGSRETHGGEAWLSAVSTRLAKVTPQNKCVTVGVAECASLFRVTICFKVWGGETQRIPPLANPSPRRNSVRLRKLPYPPAPQFTAPALARACDRRTQALDGVRFVGNLHAQQGLEKVLECDESNRCIPTSDNQRDGVTLVQELFERLAYLERYRQPGHRSQERSERPSLIVLQSECLQGVPM